MGGCWWLDEGLGPAGPAVLLLLKAASTCHTHTSLLPFLPALQWVDIHPGGPTAILSVAGTDATKKFSQQHGLDSFQVRCDCAVCHSQAG